MSLALMGRDHPLWRLYHADAENWQSRDGVMKVAEMTPQHCRNVIALLERRYMRAGSMIVDQSDGPDIPALDERFRDVFEMCPLVKSLRKRIATASDLDWIDGKWRQWMWRKQHDPR